MMSFKYKILIKTIHEKKSILITGNDNKFEENINKIENKITTGIAINIVCDYCHGPIFGQPRFLKFAEMERFFCCNSCKTNYIEKYKGRIESIKKRYKGKSEIEI